MEYVIARAVVESCSFLPLPVLRRVGTGIGWFAFRVVRIRRRVVVDNVLRSLPDKDRRAAIRIALESYKNFGRSVMEMSAFKRISAARLLDKVTIDGQDNLDEALGHGKGAILFTGHFGNWELLGAIVARRGYPLHVTDTDHSNKLAHQIIIDLRTAQGMKVISRRQPASHLLRLLSENQFVAYLADQDAGRSGVFVDFFGRPASTVRAPALFAIRRGCPIVPCFLIRERTDYHRAVFGLPIWPDPGLKGDAAVVDLTQRYTRLLEEAVRRHPEMYFWQHRRWKTKPVTRGG
jgi:KDO2-lipid IV(A) lauroyltransferase